MKRTAILSTALLFATSLAAAAQAPAQHETIHQRKVNQQRRIVQGDRSGQLTPRETGRLEHQEQGINREERGMRAQDNGHLTAQDRRIVRGQQNQESRRIYRDKHNERTDPGVPPAR
jgi:hypothetical protein